MHVPVGLNARCDGLRISFTEPLDPAVATDPKNYAVKTWGLKRSANYGSPHVGEASSEVRRATLSADGKSVLLDVAGLEPTWCMEVNYSLRAADGAEFSGAINNTIHRLANGGESGHGG
jgi:hypothetical protein